MGRSGSTLLQRVLNTHADITVWGEHGGALSGLAETWRALHHPATVQNLASGSDAAHVVIGVGPQVDRFDPWVSAFTADDFSEHLRRMILDLFTAPLDESVRWGFKEIRYGRHVMEVLLDMFPGARVVLLARDIEGQTASHFFRFGREYDLVSAAGLRDATQFVNRRIRNWMRRYDGLIGLAEAYPDRCHLVGYQDLVVDSERVKELFAELGASPPDQILVDSVLQSRTGSSYGNDSISLDDRATVTELIRAADYDRDRYEEIAMAFGIAT